jgi:hypothetical protein
VAAAIGVCIAAIYYVMNLRETTRNRRVTWANNILQTLGTEEAQLRIIEVLSMQWSDFDDFVKKYDSSRNPQNYAKRLSLWVTCNSIGFLYRSGAIDLESIDSSAATGIVNLWGKFKPVIEKYREWQWRKNSFSDFEYLADILEKRFNEEDAEWKGKQNTIFSTHAKDQ